MISDYALKTYRQSLVLATGSQDTDWVDSVFRDFWAENPTKEEFCWVMRGVLVTAEILWTVGGNDR